MLAQRPAVIEAGENVHRGAIIATRRGKPDRECGLVRRAWNLRVQYLNDRTVLTALPAHGPRDAQLQPSTKHEVVMNTTAKARLDQRAREEAWQWFEEQKPPDSPSLPLTYEDRERLSAPPIAYAILFRCSLGL
jgi:hypothetical protein